MDSRETIDHLFRREYGRIVSVLSARFSVRHIDLIEDAVQEAMYKALAVWPYKGLPAKPAAWLQRVSHNELLDRLRRIQGAPIRDAKVYHHQEPADSPEADISGLGDDTLRMLFACCHPSMTEVEQTMLSLKLVCGFGVREIAAALLKKPEAIKRALTRARVKFKTDVGELEVPVGNALRDRLNAVIRVLYLLFSEGYKSSAGEQLLQKEISEEAFRLAGMLYKHELCKSSDLCALLSLMCFTASRFPARLNADGSLSTLEAQDRSKWDGELIAAGKSFFYEAIEGVRISRYHLEAGIARCHVEASTFEETDWATILMLYNLLWKVEASSKVGLNRVVAVLHAKGGETALGDMADLEDTFKLDKDYLYHSLKAEIFYSLGNEPAEMASHMRQAIQLCKNDVERGFLKEKLRLMSG